MKSFYESIIYNNLYKGIDRDYIFPYTQNKLFFVNREDKTKNMWDWILVYVVVFFFVFIFQRMVTFFDPPAKPVKNRKNKRQLDSGKNQ